MRGPAGSLSHQCRLTVPHPLPESLEPVLTALPDPSAESISSAAGSVLAEMTPAANSSSWRRRRRRRVAPSLHIDSSAAP